MRKLVTIAILATLSFGTFTSFAEAMNLTSVDRVGPPTTEVGKGSDVCVVDCLVIPPPVRRRPLTSEEFRACSDQLGNLRRVTIHQINRVDDEDTVHLVPLCDIQNRSLTQDQKRILSLGNVGGLIPAIADNNALMAELDDGGYDVNDVIGVAVAPDAAILYVSRRH